MFLWWLPPKRKEKETVGSTKVLFLTHQWRRRGEGRAVSLTESSLLEKLHRAGEVAFPQRILKGFIVSFLFCFVCIEPYISRGPLISDYNCTSVCVIIYYSSVQSLRHVWLFATPWTAAHQASLSVTNSWSLLKLMSIELVMPSNHLILCHPLLLPPSIFPSIREFSNESVLHIRWSKYWSFRFSISPSNKYSGLIFFRMDWLDLLAVQRTLKSLLQHHSSKVSILQHSAFFIVQLF